MIDTDLVCAFFGDQVVSGQYFAVTSPSSGADWAFQPCHKVFPHLSEIAAHERKIKVVSFADEGIFNNKPTDVAAMKAFVFGRTDMNYPIYIDSHHVAYNGT